MPKSIFITTMTAGTPNLPPHEAEEEGGLQLDYDVGGVRTGGYSCVGQVPGDVGSILVQVLASDETLDVMDASDDYVFIENVDEPELAEIGPSLAPKEPNGLPRLFNRDKALTFLLSHGHATDLAQTFPLAVAEAVLMILDLHSITPEQWQHAHG